MLLEILNITAPVYLLGIAGFVWARSGTAYDIQFVSRLVLNFSLPCLIFSTFTSANLNPGALAEIAFASVFGYAVAMATMWAALKLSGLSPRIWWTAAVFGNTGNIGLPLCLFAFGETGLALAIVLMAIGTTLQFTIGVWVMTGTNDWRAVLRQPIVHATWLGICATLLGWDVPGTAQRTLELAGQITIPVMLITLGVSIARLEMGETGRAFYVSILRLIALGGSALFTAFVLKLDPLPTGVLILQFITPVAVTVYMMATRHSEKPGAIAGLILISTLLMMVVIPAVLPFLL